MSVVSPAEVSSKPSSWHGPRFLGSELRLILGRRRNQAGLVVLAVVPIVLAIALRASARKYRQGANAIDEIMNTGVYVPIAALTLECTFFLPLAISMLSADAIAGEANIGTLRYLLIVPVNRTRLLAVKYLSLLIGAAIGVFAIAVVGLAIGVALFGAGPMLTLSGLQISTGMSLLRVLAACGYLVVMLADLAALGLFVSTLTEQPLAATIALMIVVILMWIAEGINQLSWLQPWLLTHWMTAFADLIREPPLWSNMVRGMGLSGAYVVVFWLAAWARFTTKDVTS